MRLHFFKSHLKLWNSTLDAKEQKMSIAQFPVHCPMVAIPSSEDQSLARESVERIARLGDTLPQVRLVGEGIECPIPSGAAEQLAKMLFLMAGGKPVRVVPDQTEITVPEAALILDMSANRLTRLLDENLIENRMENKDRLVILESVLAYDHKRKYRHAILAKMTQEAQEMGLYD
jgi:hypothetical protein